MSRLRRFPDQRFVGARDTMRVYDCDDEAQGGELQRRIDADGLAFRNLLQSFGPDSLTEARNRGFRPPGRRASQPT